jgi:hypothetical protein
VILTRIVIYTFFIRRYPMKKLACMTLIVFAIAAGAFAQTNLTKSSTLPTVDGAIGASEYQYSGSAADMKVNATLGSDDMLYIAVEAPTSGWVAAGVGGLVMNGSRLFFGATQNGKPAFQEKAGVGHFYADAKDLVVKKWAVTTKGSVTILELSLPSSAALWKGKINSIFAYSKSPKFDSRHIQYASLSFNVK